MSAPYSEPSNEQLAAFMTVWARRMPAFDHLAISPAVLEHIFETQPKYREVALHHHRKFQEQINALSEKLQQGLLQCEHILRSGKKCPNYNVPGSHFCGLHQDEEDSQ
jgi:hypothetical protein